MIEELKSIAEKYNVHIHGNIKGKESVSFDVGQIPEIEKTCSNCQVNWTMDHQCPDALQVKGYSETLLDEKIQ